ncbi:Hypothetical predicted protein [Octopus vulgaris]|uniref:Uncharacterized protein n=1 Tax=Octopus vulgaris TaxID=6645 RepID=A0AA36AT47_OCTVU|nr:Hypothetical predicted protein [Octopus vulgaris]
MRDELRGDGAISGRALSHRRRQRPRVCGLTVIVVPPPLCFHLSGSLRVSSLAVRFGAAALRNDDGLKHCIYLMLTASKLRAGDDENLL